MKDVNGCEIDLSCHCQYQNPLKKTITSISKLIASDGRLIPKKKLLFVSYVLIELASEWNFG